MKEFVFGTQDFFMDLYDEPEKVHEMLTLLCDSITSFARWSCRMNGAPEVSDFGASIFDDFAALVPPDKWSEFVIPYWNRFFEDRTTGKNRFVHCEDTYPEQLRYLKDAKITFYQPCVSERLTFENIRENTDVEFDWFLYPFHITEMTDSMISAWVDYTVQSGVRIIHTEFGRYAWENGKIDRILAFYKAFEKYRVE